MADGSVMTADRKFVEKNNTIICLPGAVSQNQMAAIVTSALKMTFAVFPGDKDLAAAGTVTAAMLQAQTSAARICDRRDPVLFRYRMACP